MKITYQQRFILFGAILVGLIVIWYFGFYSLQNKKIASIKAEIAKINNDLNRAKDSSTEIKKLKDEIATLTEEVDSLKEKIPSKGELLNLSNLIKKRGGQYGLNFIRIYPQKEVLFAEEPGGSSIVKIPINILLTGSYFNLGKFLDSFDSFPFLLKAGSVSISADDNKYPVLDIDLTLHTYLYY